MRQIFELIKIDNFFVQLRMSDSGWPAHQSRDACVLWRGEKEVETMRSNPAQSCPRERISAFWEFSVPSLPMIEEGGAGQITLVTSLTGITELLHSLCRAVVMVEVVE
jgi:hypothetical protein